MVQEVNICDRMNAAAFLYRPMTQYFQKKDRVSLGDRLQAEIILRHGEASF